MVVTRRRHGQHHDGDGDGDGDDAAAAAAADAGHCFCCSARILCIHLLQATGVVVARAEQTHSHDTRVPQPRDDVDLGAGLSLARFRDIRVDTWHMAAE